MEGKKILIIDDDINLSHILHHTFKREGATVYTAADGREGLHLFFSHRPDLVLLDIRMPDIDGWETCRQIRLLSNTPIIMLTTLNRNEEVVRGLDLGADDFVTKPFSRDVLLARARATLRRNEELTTEQPKAIYRDDYLVVDLQERCVLVKGEQIKLSAREFDLLSYLVENAGRILTHQQILDRIWGWEYRNNPDYLHVYFSHLRRKLEKDPKNPEYLRTEHGVGYRFYKARYH
ncbi:MAG: response regulator transcription factor [Chloroflexi bacterium]|nr:response regulator transcription factor [Chloroflexota bacterium]